MRRVMAALAVAAVGMAGAAAAAAQAPRGLREVHAREGFWLGVGAGGGWEDARDAFGTAGRGGSFYLRLGGTPNQHVLFGGEVLTWFNDVNGVSRSRTNVAATALVYPSVTAGWFVKGGFGVASRDRFQATRSGIATTFGTGYDFKLGGNFYVTPNADYMVQFLSDETIGSMLFTLGVTWH